MYYLTDKCGKLPAVCGTWAPYQELHPRPLSTNNAWAQSAANRINGRLMEIHSIWLNVCVYVYVEAYLYISALKKGSTEVHAKELLNKHLEQRNFQCFLQ